MNNKFMKKFVCSAILLATLPLTACSDSTSAVIVYAESSSSEESLSSSDNVISSSSEMMRSSSSAALLRSSSSEKPSVSSSSLALSSSEAKMVQSSSSVDGFDWNIPKEAYLNSDIQYDSITDERDGKVYKTVKIGNQVWMAENLNYSDSVKTPSLLEHSWCFGNDEKKCDVAGRYYAWAAVVDSVALATDLKNPQDCGNGKSCTFLDKIQGICPNGWHLPDTTEWRTLFVATGDSSAACKILKSHIGWYNYGIIADDIGNGTNDVGFSAIPVGYRSVSEGFNETVGVDAFFWSATEYNMISNYKVVLSSSVKYAFFNQGDRSQGFPIRCVKD